MLEVEYSHVFRLNVCKERYFAELLHTVAVAEGLAVLVCPFAGPSAI